MHVRTVRGQSKAALPCDSGLDWRGRRRCRLSGPQAAGCLVGQNLFCQSNCKEKGSGWYTPTVSQGMWVREEDRRGSVCVCAWSPPPTQHAHTQSRWQPVMLCPLLLCVPGSMRNSLMACGTLVWVYVQVLTSASLLTHHLKRFRNVPRLSKIFALPGVKMLIGFLSLIFKWMSEKPAEVTNLLTRSAWIPWLILCLDNDFLRKLMNILFEMNFFSDNWQLNSLIQRFEWCTEHKAL